MGTLGHKRNEGHAQRRFGSDKDMPNFSPKSQIWKSLRRGRWTSSMDQGLLKTGPKRVKAF